MGENEKGLNPKQIRGLEEAYKKIETLENEVQTMKESMLTREEFAELMKSGNEAFKRALNGEGVHAKVSKVSTSEW